MDLECQVLQFSLFHHYFGFFFVQRDLSRRNEKLEKRMVTVSPSFSTPPRRISIVPEVPSPFDTSAREMSLSFENHQVEISLEDPRSIVSPGASSAPLTEDFTEVFPNLDINVTTPTKYPLMEELGVLNEMVDNMRVDLLQSSMLLTYIKDNFEKK